MQVVSVTPVVGLPQVNGWSQVIDHVYGGSHLIGTLSVAGANAGGVGRDIVTQILDQQPSTAQQVYEFVEYLSKITREQQCELSLTLGLFADGRCIISSVYGTAWLKRKNKVGALVESEGEVGLLEGTAQDDDTFIFSTQAARQFLPTIELQFGQGFDVDGVITSIVPAIHSLEDSSKSAVAFISTTARDQAKIEDLYKAANLIEEVERKVVEDRPIIGATSSAVGHASEWSVPAEFDSHEHQRDTAHSRIVEQPALENLQHIESQTTQFTQSIPATPVRRKISFTTWRARISDFVPSIKRLFSKKTYVGEHVSNRSLATILIGVVCILALLGGGVYYVLHLRAQRALASEMVAPFTTRIDAAKAAAGNDPLSARSNLDAIISELVALQSQYSETGSTQVRKALEEAVTEAQGAQQEISGQEAFSQLPIFYDLRLASSDFVTNLATVQGEKSIFIDSQKKQMIVLDLPTKQVFTKDLTALEPVVSISPQEENVAVVATGVFAIPLTADGAPTPIKEVGDSNRAAKFVNSFGSYVYIFNPEKRNIYRYSKSEGSFSDPIGWLQDPLGVPFESVTSFMIDGDVWISTQLGEIKKFTSGRAVAFEITGLQEAFETPVFLFTQEGAANLYVLEPEKKRVAIISKDGQFIREVRSDSLASATTFFVNEQLGRVFAISGSIVYEVGL